MEDNSDDEELTIRSIRRAKIVDEIIVMPDGKEALDFLFCESQYATRKEENPAVILLDLNLPKINGIDVLNQIRAADRTKCIPVVVLTSSAEDVDMVNSYKFGAKICIRKPFNFCEFTEALKTLGVLWVLSDR